MTMNPNYWRLFRRSTAAGLVLLVLVGSSPTAEAGFWVKRDWSKVQAVAPGTRTTVLLYKDQAPPGKRKIEGRFQLARAESITLLLSDGQTHTLQREAVHKVLVYRPIEKRYEGWVTAGVITAIIAGAAARGEGNSDPLPAGVGAAIVGLVVGVPTVVAFLAAPKMGDIYNVPPDRRDPSSTQTAPSQQGSSTAVPEVTEARGGPTGSGLESCFLREPSGADLLRQQARQALIRKGLPLDLSVPSP